MSVTYSREAGRFPVSGLIKEIPNQTIHTAAEPLMPEYRVLPITDGFSWPRILDAAADAGQLDSDQLYLVVFRSERRDGVDPAFVERLDADAHAEAAGSDALLYYYAGDLDQEDRAMSWCLWKDREAARFALSGPAHRLAVRHAPEIYSSFGVELYDVTLPGDRQVVFAPHEHPGRST